MGKIDYRAIEDLQGQVSSHYNSISKATATISSIDAKLAKLRSAKQSVGNIRSEIHEIKISVMVQDDQPQWNGQQKENFWRQWEGFGQDFNACQRELDAFHDAICDEITRLENQKLDQQSFIGWCQAQINNLGNFIEKLLN